MMAVPIKSLRPSFKAFQAHYSQGETQVVWTESPADLETPVSAMRHLAPHTSYPFLLESRQDGEFQGRYSIIGIDPDAIWRVQGEQAEISYGGQFVPQSGEILGSLRDFINSARFPLPSALPPVAAGVFGYMGYDMVRHMEHLPEVNPDSLGIPDSIFLRPSVTIIFDSFRDVMMLVTTTRPHKNKSAQTAYEEASQTLSRTMDLLHQPPQKEPERAQEEQAPVSNMTLEEYYGAVSKAREYILAGDVMQVVLSQRFTIPFSSSPFTFYRALRRINPSPYLFFMDFGAFQVAGSSPETLVQCFGDTVRINPIAGTHARGRSAQEDKKIGKALLANPKERAEHLMLLDLARNDLGRVAQIGSVTAQKQFVLQHTSHLIHIASHVTGTLAAGKSALDALVAGFPAGTVSGAPKVRAMEIIDELEKEKRGLYAGAVGYFSANGHMDSCIALRTAVFKNRTMFVQAGSGIVADSELDYEHQECLNKAKALFQAMDELPHDPPHR